RRGGRHGDVSSGDPLVQLQGRRHLVRDRRALCFGEAGEEVGAERASILGRRPQGAPPRRQAEVDRLLQDRVVVRETGEVRIRRVDALAVELAHVNCTDQGVALTEVLATAPGAVTGWPRAERAAVTAAIHVESAPDGSVTTGAPLLPPRARVGVVRVID